MEIELAFGQGPLRLNLPDHIRSDSFSPTAGGEIVSFEAFTSKLSGITFGTAPLIIVNDAYRGTDTKTILDWLDSFSPGILSRSAILIACGTHIPPSQQQIVKLLGDRFQSNTEKVFVHNCDDLSMMKKLGVDSDHGSVWINKMLFDHDQIIAVSSVEPHYFAGFTGGRKSFFPGLTDRETIVRNHNRANSLEAQPCRIEGNPVAEHLGELIGFLDQSNILSIQMIQDVNGSIAEIYCGNLQKTFDKGRNTAAKYYLHEIDDPFDILICQINPPLDKSLYQAQKALENCQGGVKDGGAIILVSACSEGIGSPSFYNLADEWDKEKNRHKSNIDHFGSHKLSRVIKMGKRITVYLHSQLDSETVRHVFYEPLDDIQRFIDEKIRINNKLSVGIVRDAGGTVLKMSQT